MSLRQYILRRANHWAEQGIMLQETLKERFETLFYVHRYFPKGEVVDPDESPVTPNNYRWPFIQDSKFDKAF